ncbi:membrane protein implicated in regulation of membrane protease activity [Brevibacillus nitrificans]|nr:membrane protein implicated in regulation of membrane protease activity [Brevibacillus nitrificans]
MGAAVGFAKKQEHSGRFDALLFIMTLKFFLIVLLFHTYGLLLPWYNRLEINIFPNHKNCSEYFMDMNFAFFALIVIVSVVTIYSLLKKTNQHLQRIEDLLFQMIEKKV